MTNVNLMNQELINCPQNNSDRFSDVKVLLNKQASTSRSNTS
jgi:hypothetical protein